MSLELGKACPRLIVPEESLLSKIQPSQRHSKNEALGYNKNLSCL